MGLDSSNLLTENSTFTLVERNANIKFYGSLLKMLVPHSLYIRQGLLDQTGKTATSKNKGKTVEQKTNE